MLPSLLLAADPLAWLLSGPDWFDDSRQASVLMDLVQSGLILSQLVSTLLLLLVALG